MILRTCLESPGKRFVLSGYRLRSRETNASSLFSSSAREAGGFGCLSGKTNTLPQISSSHSPELVLAKTPLSGDSIKAQANHTFEDRGPPRGGVDGLGGVQGGCECPRLEMLSQLGARKTQRNKVSWHLSLDQVLCFRFNQLPRCWQKAS